MSISFCDNKELLPSCSAKQSNAATPLSLCRLHSVSLIPSSSVAAKGRHVGAPRRENNLIVKDCELPYMFGFGHGFFMNRKKKMLHYSKLMS